MGQAAILSEREQHGSGELIRTSSFETLQELTRHGYMPDSQPLPHSAGLLLRHRSGPDLILHPDGTVGVPLGQSVNESVAPKVKVPKKRRWGRALLIFTALAIYSLLSFALLIAITE